MTAKERVLRAINHEEVDRIPIGIFGTHLDYEEGLAAHVGVGTIEEMYRNVGIDVWHCRGRLAYAGPEKHSQGVKTNIWGIPEKMSETSGYSHQGAPLSEVSSVDEVEAYPWPSADEFEDTGLDQDISDHEEFAVVGGINSAIFHIFTYVCGFDNALMMLNLEPEISKAIIRRITDFWAGYLRKVLEIGNGRIDVIENCNDFGTQRSLFISRETFREFFLPPLKRLYDITKEYDAKVMQHSCGSIAPLIPDFIEMGADILNPIQVAADNMVLGELVPKYGESICFYGGIDTQHVLPEGPIERIREDARHLIGLFGRGGGLILSGSQGLLPDIPYDHAMAMFEEATR